MEKRKSEAASLENKRTIFLEIGFVIALLAVFFAMEYRSYDKQEYNLVQREIDDTPEEIIPITEQKVKPPPPPKPPPQTTVLNVVEDDVEVEDEIEIDVDIDDDTEVEAYVPPVDDNDEEEAEEEILMVVQEMPEFPGGEAAMYGFIGKNIKYPKIAKETGVSGRVWVTFVVEKNGSVSRIKVLRGIGAGCDEEAMRVIKAMPKWKPGMQMGKAVRVQYQIPIKFTLH